MEQDMLSVYSQHPPRFQFVSTLTGHPELKKQWITPSNIIQLYSSS